MNKGALKSTIKREKDIIVCTLDGEISYESVIQLRNEFAEIRNIAPKTVILDLIKFTSSLGVFIPTFDFF